MRSVRPPTWRTATRIGILAGLALLAASFVVRDVQSQAFTQNETLRLALMAAAVAGALVTVGCVAVNYDGMVRLVTRRGMAADVNTIVSSVLAMALTVLVCYVSTRRFARLDMTGKRYYTLHSKTKQMVRSLDRPLRVTLVYHEDQTLRGQLARWAEEQALDTLSEFQALNSNITVEEIRWDSDRGRLKLEELQNRLDMDIVERCIILESGDLHPVVPLLDIVQAPTYAGGSLEFVGESAFAAALAKILSEEKQNVYFLTGHGERPIEPPVARSDMADESIRESETASLSKLVKMLEADNFEAKTLSLTGQGRAPEDCEVLVVAGPRSELREAELEAIRRYLGERNGNLIVMLDCMKETNFGGLLAEYGVKVHLDALAMSSPALLELTPQGIIQPASPEVPVTVEGYASHPITRDVRNYELLFAFCSPVEILEARPTERLSARALLTSVEGTWGERSMAESMRRSKFDKGRDIAGPVIIAAVVEPSATPVAGAADPTGPRLAVFGSSYPFLNQEFHYKRAALVLNAVNWMAGKHQMLGIPPKDIASNEADLTAKQVRAARWIFLLAVPACIVALGMAVWRMRQH